MAIITTSYSLAATGTFSVTLAANTKTVYTWVLGVVGGARTLNSITLDGVAATELGATRSVDGGWAVNSALSVWNSAALPLAAGSYDVIPTWSGSSNASTLWVIESDEVVSSPYHSAIQNSSDFTVFSSPQASTGTISGEAGNVGIGLAVAGDGSGVTGTTISANSANLSGLQNETGQASLQSFCMVDDVIASAAEAYSMTIDPGVTSLDTGYGIYFAIPAAAPTGITITAPDTIQDGVATTITGTDLATATTVKLDVDGSAYLVDNTSNATLGGASIAWTPETNFGSISAQPTVPFTDATLHTGAVAPVVRTVLTDE